VVIDVEDDAGLREAVELGDGFGGPARAAERAGQRVARKRMTGALADGRGRVREKSGEIFAVVIDLRGMHLAQRLARIAVGHTVRAGGRAEAEEAEDQEAPAVAHGGERVPSAGEMHQI